MAEGGGTWSGLGVESGAVGAFGGGRTTTGSFLEAKTSLGEYDELGG